MNVLIIEDEKPASEKLALLLRRYDSEITIREVLPSVASSVEWFRDEGNTADLIFMDIRLSDGLCFDIFREVSIRTPVIFTTAYNEYALQAFKVNAIDYLLKPVSYDELYKSMEKLASLRENLADVKSRIRTEELNKLISHFSKNYKSRFMIKIGEHIRSVKTDDISLFFADGRHVFVLTTQGREYLIDYKMEELPELLDPEQYFRLNRTFIVNINAIKDVIAYSNTRLKVLLHQSVDKELIVSREKVVYFKQWFGMR